MTEINKTSQQSLQRILDKLGVKSTEDKKVAENNLHSNNNKITKKSKKEDKKDIQSINDTEIDKIKIETNEEDKK